MNNVVENLKMSPKKPITAKQLAKYNLTKRKNPDWDNLDRGYRYLTLDMKLPHDQAIAVMGNVVEESLGNYKAKLKNGKGQGLIQWDKAPNSRYGLWGSIWASVAKPANVYDTNTDTVKNYWAPWGGLKGDKVRLKFIKAPLKLKTLIYAESYLRPGKPRIADRQLSAMLLDSIYNPRIKNILILKQGGKMNILEFLKNGSGIHIKKENRGKFTSYCGGTVTDECIRRGKNSSSATIRKRATFAANARKWKHKKGGKAFVEGVNVLDSNPEAYKYVKKKYKMRSAAGGSKVDWGGVANTIGGLSNSVMNIAKTFKNQKAIDLMKEANASMLNAYKSQAINNAYNDALNSESDKSDIVNRFNAYHKAANSASQIVALKLRELDLQVAQAEQANAAAQLEAWTGAIKDLGGLAINALNKKGMTLKAATNTSSNDSMFSKNVNVGGTDYKAFNTPTYKSFGDWADANTFKKEGTIDSNGFMNTRLGKMDMNFNIVKLPIKTDLFNYKLNI